MTSPATEQSLASPRVVAWRTRHLVMLVLPAGLILAALAAVASQGDPNAVDLGATRWIQQFQQPLFAALMYAVSWFGFAPQTWFLPLLVASPFALRRMWTEALWVLGSEAAALATLVLKAVVHRARPSPELVGVATPLSDPSFPSGHVVQYTVLFGVSFFLVFVLPRRSIRRTAALVLLALPIVLVGASRLYLGQHWLSDVLGGYALAVVLLVPYCWAYTKWHLEVSHEQTTSQAHGRTHQAAGTN